MKNNKTSKKKCQQILATLVMGMNVANSMAPMALAMQKTQDNANMPVRSVPKSEAEPLEYTVLPEILNAVENMVFGKAEAADYPVNSGETSVVSTLGFGDNQYISAGGTGIVNVVNSGGRQDVLGVGTIITMNGGSQMVSSGGIGTVSTMSGGRQYIRHRGTGTVSTLCGGIQNVDYGGTGIVITMSAGSQNISAGGTGIVITMSGGIQNAYDRGTGIVSTLSGGIQNVDYGGTGIVITMSAGSQNISAGGTGIVSTMSAGSQNAYGGGTGIVITMSAGSQNAYGGGTGIVSTLSGGIQNAYGGGTGVVITMSAGSQDISAGGTGTVSTMSDGSQDVARTGIGIVGIMDGGSQRIFSGGTGTVSTMDGGLQWISSGGTGTVSAMNGGLQALVNGGEGIVVTMNGGVQYGIVGGTGTISTMIGGTQVIDYGTGTVSAMSGGTQIITGGGTVMDTTLYGGTQLILDSRTVKNTTIYGGTAIMMDASAFVDGLSMTGGTYLLGGNGGSYKIAGKFNFAGGDVDMTKASDGTKPGTYETLTIAKLERGGGTFIMDTNLASESNSDKVNITDSSGGNYYIQVNDVSLTNGLKVEGDKKLLLVTDASEKVTFTGKDLNNGGLWTATPEIKNGINVTDDLGNVIGTKDQWYLTHVKLRANNDTKVLLEGVDGSYALWRNTMDTLRKRLGELHYSAAKHDEGLWARYLSGKFNGTGFDGSYNMYQLGYDKAHNAKSVYGFALENGTGRSNYSLGSGKDKLFAGSFYGTWSADDGRYTDVTVKIGQFDTDIKSYGDYPDKGSYKARGYSLSVEYGKKIDLRAGRYIEPQLQFTAGRLSGVDYTTDRGNSVRIGGMNSYVGRIGFTAGQKTTDGNDVYLKASLLHEFGGSRDIHMQAANGETMSRTADYKDTWFEVGLGTNIKLSKASSFYGDIERSFGGEIEKKWQINAGLRFSF